MVGSRKLSGETGPKSIPKDTLRGCSRVDKEDEALQDLIQLLFFLSFNNLPEYIVRGC